MCFKIAKYEFRFFFLIDFQLNCIVIIQCGLYDSDTFNIF